jgi:hypothetical protein
MTDQVAANVRRSRDSADSLLLGLQRDAIRYFIDNQLAHGLMLDRQRNHGRRKFTGLCSLSATGMGLIALALASSAEHRMLTRAQACKRIKRALRTALNLPQVGGMLPHFVDARTLAPAGSDPIATVDAAWLFTGALWAAEFLGDDELTALANQLCDRVDWLSWGDGGPVPRLHHGAGAQGKKLASVWDRFNAETVCMYLLGIGAKKNALPAACLHSLDLAHGCLPKDGPVEEQSCFISADLGLFVFQYGLEMLDPCQLPSVNGAHLLDECVKAVRANYAFCRKHRMRYQTFQTFWGLSAGDGPCNAPCIDAYRAYSPEHDLDGTAHITATLASIGVWPDLVRQNLDAAESPQWRHIRGRYGYSNVNVDHNFVSRDVVGIDIGAAMFALENVLFADRVRKVFMRTPVIRRALRRLHAFGQERA